MPRLRTLDFRLSVQEVRGINGRDGGIDLGLRNLPSLQKVWVHLDPEGANKAEVKELEAELTRAIKIHPNHPQLYGIQDEDAGVQSAVVFLASHPFPFFLTLICFAFYLFFR